MVNNVQPKENHFIVFIIYNDKFEDLTVEPNIYVVPSSELESMVETYGKERRVMKGRLGDYKNKWEYFI